MLTLEENKEDSGFFFKKKGIVQKKIYCFLIGRLSGGTDLRPQTKVLGGKRKRQCQKNLASPGRLKTSSLYKEKEVTIKRGRQRAREPEEF